MIRSGHRDMERYAKRVVEDMMPLYRRAFVAEARGDAGANVLWARVRLQLRKQWIVFALLGMTGQRRALVRQRLVPPVRNQKRVSVEEPNFSDDGPFGDSWFQAVNYFRFDVPNLQEVLWNLNGHAGHVAEKITARQRLMSAEIIGHIVRRVTAAALDSVEKLDLTEQAMRTIVEDVGVRPVRTQVETQVKTAMSGAYNHGSREIIRRNISAVPVTMLVEIRDARTRGNPRGKYPDAPPHYQMDRFCAPSDDPIWDRITPPNGWRCRGGSRGMSVPEVRRRGWLTDSGELDREKLRSEFAAQWGILERGEYPDPGFKQEA